MFNRCFKRLTCFDVPAENVPGGAVEIGEFFKGCLRLRGQARGVDVGRIMHETWITWITWLSHPFSLEPISQCS